MLSSDRKKVLIISYYWPPAGGSGVQRWLKFSKYLRDFGWEPVIYTAKNPEVPVVDESLNKDIPLGVEVIRTNVPEPFKLYRKITGKKANEPVSLVVDVKNQSLFQRVAMFIRGNFFIPDAKMWWIKPSFRSLKARLLRGDIQAIVSTGPPHTCHVIAMKLKKEFNHIPWLADFRDPWTKIDFLEELNLTQRALKKHQLLEKEVVQKADAVVVIGKSLKSDFEHHRQQDIHVITNGFDQESEKNHQVPLDQKFTLSHIGIYSKTRHHRMLLEVIADLRKKDAGFASDFQLQLVGQVDEVVQKEVEEFNLQSLVAFKPFVRHEEVGDIQRASRMLYLSINRVENAKGILTGKIFEYMDSGRPILLIGPADGDAAHLLQNLENVWVVPFDDRSSLKKAIKEQYSRFKSQNDGTIARNINKYSRKALTGEIAQLLDELISGA